MKTNSNTINGLVVHIYTDLHTHTHLGILIWKSTIKALRLRIAMSHNDKNNLERNSCFFLDNRFKKSKLLTRVFWISTHGDAKPNGEMLLPKSQLTYDKMWNEFWMYNIKYALQTMNVVSENYLIQDNHRFGEDFTFTSKSP